jgi:hypothetical protein
MSYAIISLGGKQYRVHEGEKLLVDRVTTDEGKTFHPDVLFVGGDGKADFKPREGREDPHRQVPQANRLPAAHGLPQLALADRDHRDRSEAGREAPCPR